MRIAYIKYFRRNPKTEEKEYHSGYLLLFPTPV